MFYEIEMKKKSLQSSAYLLPFVIFFSFQTLNFEKNTLLGSFKQVLQQKCVSFKNMNVLATICSF